jgi:acetyl esterase/lipase
VRLLLLLLFLLLPSFARTLRERLGDAYLEAVHAQRVQWMMKRVAAPLPGIYADYRAQLISQPPDGILSAAKAAGVRIVLTEEGTAGLQDGVLFYPFPNGQKTPEFEDPDDFSLEVQTPKERRGVDNKFKQFPDEVFAVTGAGWFSAYRDFPWRVALHHASTHILARDLTQSDIRDSLAKRRTYFAHDWLCDPAGFLFVAENDVGVFDIGDSVELAGRTSLFARLPVVAKIQVLRNDEVVKEATDSKLTYIATEPGAYRIEASLTVDGEEYRWIRTSPIQVVKGRGLSLPMGTLSPEVEAHKDIVYTDGAPEDVAKHKLDLYLPKDKKNFPVMIFLHGGSWRSGDRSWYALLGNRFAKAGIGVAIPSYRLMPKNPHPAQIEDAAAAFAWVYRKIADYGGDVTRIYVTGHSAGGHLAALLALDPEFLKKYDIPITAIRGVASMSGVYNVKNLQEFQAAEDDPSPIDHIHPQAPPFLLTYCQWDYLDLPRQARNFAEELKKKFVGVKLEYIPGENHISEIIDTLKDSDPTAHALLDFIK